MGALINTLGGIISLFSNQDDKTGYVKYRRYFRVNRPTDLDFLIDNKFFKIKTVHFKLNQFRTKPIITVDIIEKIYIDTLKKRII